MQPVNRDMRSYPISSNSRSKLNAFRYTSKDGTEPETSPKKTPSKKANANKENQASWLNGVAAPPLDRSKEEPSLGAAESKPIKECPQTPGNRIPLADLIGNAEDAITQAPGPQFTPEDYVTWQHVPASSNQDPMSQTPAIKGRKRRHSSSPTSSPLAGNSKNARKGSFDLQAYQGLIKTPQNDLATELWNNYVGKMGANGTKVPQPQLPNILSSSPQTPVSLRTSRDSSGLRRSTSCLAEWPNSAAKRRKVDGERLGNGRGIFSRTRSTVADSSSFNPSKINFLVETIERSLRETPAAQPDPSGSPIPASKRGQRDRSASPVYSKGAPQHTTRSNQENGDQRASGSQGTRTVQKSSSDFGDDDLDDDFFDLAQASMDPFVEPSQHGTAMGAMNTNYAGVLASANQQSLPDAKSISDSNTMGSAPAMNTNNQSEYTLDADEFDDDFDEFSDNIEDILAECEATQNTKLARPAAKNFLASDHPGSLKSMDSSMPPLEPVKGASKPVETSSGDEFDDDDFDMEAIEQSMMQSGEKASNGTLNNRQAIKRYLIVDVAESTYTTPKGRIQPEQVLLVHDERTKQKKVVILRDSWFDSPCNKDLYIHLIGDFDANGHCVVDDSHNMIILHPDHLVSATVVADSVSCQRRAVLQDRIKNTGDIGKPQVFGNIFHEVFQEAMKTNQWDTASLRSLVEIVAVKHIEELYLIHMSIAEAVEYMMSKVPAMVSWAELFLKSQPSAQSLVEDRNSSKLRLSISKLLEVEEHVWSPMYGLKGNIDATVQVACHEEGNKKNLVVPLELKTGNRDTNQAHRAQTALYTLLLSDRYDLDVTFGLLYYLETAKIFRIRGIRHELLQMIQARNRLAGYMRQRTELPPMVKRAGMCNKCFSKTPCFIYHKLADDGDGETSGLGDEFVKAMEHLNPQHRDFFQKWDSLLTKEEQSMMRFKRELWTLLSSEREALGRCFGNIVIEPGTTYEDKDGLKINRYRYTFIKKHASANFSFTESQLTVGEPIVISDEKGHFALANGYIVQVSTKRITVAVDRRLRNARSKTKDFDANSNQSFKGIMEILDSGATQTTTSAFEPEEEVLYRLDKDEFSNGMAIVRANLVAMMERDLFQARQLRRLIIEGEAPVFKPTESTYKMPEAERASLNVDQKQAIDKVMSAQDYALVLGMPGTGKTTTIAHIIRALVAQGKSVLLTSYTHTAVDNILLKIREDNIRILRIGAAAKVHPDVQQFVNLAAAPKSTMEELKAAYEDSQVVATTCLGVSHNIFSQRTFDYCIVDEASQITLPVCLGPIRMASTFILVGDHYQLPPLVQNKEAQEGGLDVSLFKLLSDTHPQSVVNLEHQYRMCDQIMLLSNTLIYSGHLKCGTPEVAARSLVVPHIGGLKQHHSEPFSLSGQRQLCLGATRGHCWLHDLLDPDAKTRLVNTDKLATPARDVATGSRIVNPTEATLCAQLVEAFISSGIPARSIGVITFYRSQLSLLKQNLRRHLPDLEMHTADKFQGRDKEVVILSCVRSNADKHVGDLLRDWRRVNVAFTRARTKLLVVGSKSTLRDGNELLGKYVKLMEEQGWVYDLPRDAVDNHHFDFDSLTHTQPPLQEGSTPSPNKSPSPHKKPSTRNPLSPLRGRQAPQGGLRKPAKKGIKLLSGNNVLGNRPVLQDVVNDLVG
ncbi:bifunctional ATP-dependent DNA helicase/ssDNA endodeoxyribonuclease DNA2 [Aspergillus melleus]|uniref:bifunctional ATP-dependent DNA helicase/ssDNA endodeoxyribonuclease DNA2 n=1 Tax=Aspergillus melleus TaxID=138277 RepID=UPI001E8EE637|nr:DNA replication endonuclease-helicase Dna2 [Aspergillus melleus]KAH8422669.1 DNA replication endonuclease-helicase Dna2 [Aspergillus melleus]